MTFGPIPDYEIERLARSEPPLITPFNPDALNPFGVDITLGNKLRRLSPSWNRPLDVFNPPPCEAWEDHELKDGEHVLVQFGELWLAQTREFFCLPNNIQCLMLNRSKYARCGATPNAGLAPGDAGWRGFYVLELLSHARQGVLYTVGERVAQAMFLRGATCRKSYDDTHTYQNQTQIIGPRV
jgi:deoxycytidine triphosphate deaminase